MFFQIGIKKCKIFSIGTNFFFTIGIKIIYMFTSFNWYQNFGWFLQKCFMYFQLVLSIVSSSLIFNALFTFNWYSSKKIYFCWFAYLFIFNWYHDALNWYIFLIGIIMFWFNFTPWVFLFRTKRGRTLFYWFSLTPLLMIDKKGEKYLSLFEFICMFLFCFNWYKESLFYVLLILVSRVWILVSSTCLF